MIDARDAFEAWGCPHLCAVQHEGLNPPKMERMANGKYYYKAVEDAWIGWQAAKADLGNCTQCKGTGNFKPTVFNVNFSEPPDRPDEDDDA